MTVAAFHDALKTLLLADSDLVDWATTWTGGSWTAVDGNVQVAKIRPEELPALVFELGDGEATPITVGGGRQDAVQELLVAVVWHDPDPAAAFAARAELPELLAEAIIADPTLGGAVAGAWLTDWQSDRNAVHPIHVVRGTVRGEFQIAR